MRVADRQRAGDGQLHRELDAGVVVRRDLVPVDVVDGEHRVRVVREDFDGQRVGASPQVAGDVEGEPGVGAGDGGAGGDLLAVDPNVGIADHAVHDQVRDL